MGCELTASMTGAQQPPGDYGRSIKRANLVVAGNSDVDVLQGRVGVDERDDREVLAP